MSGELRAKIVTAVTRQNLKRYGPVTRISGLAKTILQEIVQRERDRRREKEMGGQRKRWEDRERDGRTENEMGGQRKRWKDRE